jgi:hypothetical protein
MCYTDAPEYPEHTGMGLTLGEGMAGMTPQQRENWMKETIIEGNAVLPNRKSSLFTGFRFLELLERWGATSIEMEQITRKGIEKEADHAFPIDGPGMGLI